MITNNQKEINYSQLRILVLDDDMFMLEFIIELLSELGLTDVLTDTDGAQALLTTQEHAPNVIICDLKMPNMDGVEFLRMLAEQGYTGGIILITGENINILKAAERLVLTYNLNLLGVL